MDLGRLIEQLDSIDKWELVQEILEKKAGESDRDWAEIVEDFDLECSPETLRKAGVGVKLASDAGMKFPGESMEKNEKDFIERQKLFDIQRGIRKDLREISRTELLAEKIGEAIRSLPEIRLDKFYTGKADTGVHERDLVVGIGDFHYGASFTVYGLYGEVINSYDSIVFDRRMAQLTDHVADIVQKENPDQVTIMIVGDMLDGMIHQHQLSRLEYGAVESAMVLSETLAMWLAGLEERVQIPIRVYAVRGNHGEIRPLGSKAGQFPEENLERVVMHYLRARFEDHEWIYIADGDAPMTQMVDVAGYQFMMTHGQGVNIESMARDCVNLYNKSIDVFLVGHLHKGQTFQSGIKNETNIYVERVPSLCGMDPYAQSIGCGGQAGATAILMEAGYGRRCLYPIVLK